MAHLVEKELNEFKDSWNNHRIRANDKTALPSGIPNDLYWMPSVYGKLLGVDDHIQPVSTNLWILGMENESCPVPQFYPLSYKVRANQLLKDKLHMKREQITIENMENVYNILVSNYLTMIIVNQKSVLTLWAIYCHRARTYNNNYSIMLIISTVKPNLSSIWSFTVS